MKGHPNSLDSIFEESDKYTPIIFLLESGADPLNSIVSFAEARKAQLITVSLGQGQAQVALNNIEASRKGGMWVLLQNCHLARTFMADLESVQEKKDIGHDNYRLFLTSMPNDYFPVAVLQNSIKLTTEPPKGIKNNLRHSTGNLTEEYLALGGQHSDSVSSLLFRKLTLGLCYFHAIVQERNRFGALGFNIKYQFNESDLETSKTVLKLLVE